MLYNWFPRLLAYKSSLCFSFKDLQIAVHIQYVLGDCGFTGRRNGAGSYHILSTRLSIDVPVSLQQTEAESNVQ